MKKDVNIFLCKNFAISRLQTIKIVNTILIKSGKAMVTINSWGGIESKYNAAWLEEADIVVFALVDNHFGGYSSYFTSPLRIEYNRAINLKKQVFIYYETKNSGSQLYSLDTSYKEQLRGLPGTYEYFQEVCEKIYLEKNKPIIDSSGSLKDSNDVYYDQACPIPKMSPGAQEKWQLAINDYKCSKEPIVVEQIIRDRRLLL